MVHSSTYTRRKFLSTLSLRRATAPMAGTIVTAHISIHALLAESDQVPPLAAPPAKQFLSTLSLRRATVSIALNACCRHGFLSTLSLRRATHEALHRGRLLPISIHALLAESDG